MSAEDEKRRDTTVENQSSPMAGSTERWTTSVDAYAWKRATLTASSAGHLRTLPYRVAIEGNISSGKSTLVEALGKLSSEKVPNQMMIRPVMESILPKLLEEFLSDPVRHALTLQLNTMSRRRLGYDTRIHESPGSGNLIVFDRFMDGDGAFMIKNALSGFIGQRGVQVYLSSTNIKTLADLTKGGDGLPLLDGVIYLHSTPASCHRNVQQRGDVDAGYPPLYLVEVDLVHFYELMAILLASNDEKEQIQPIYLIDWRQFGETDEFVRQLVDKIVTRQGHGRARIQWADPETADKFRKKRQQEERQRVKWMDEELVPGACVFSYDDSDVLETKTVRNPKFLPCLQCRFRTIHTQAWRDSLVQMSQAGKTILLVPNIPHRPKSTLLDFFIGFPKTLIDCVPTETNLSQLSTKPRWNVWMILSFAVLIWVIVSVWYVKKR